MIRAARSPSSSVQPWPRLALGLGLLGLVVLTALGLWARLAGLDQARMVMDALHPFLRALAILRGDDLPWRGAGGDFRFGAGQTWSMVPVVAAAWDLRSMIGGYAVVHALGVPLLGLAGRRLGGWLTGLGAAGLYAVWPVLLGHPVRGAQTYLAPVLLAAAVLVALRLVTPPERPSSRGAVGLGLLLGALLALAVHHHPYAIAAAAGAVVLLPWILRRRGWRAMVAALVSGALVLAPMVVDNILLLRERQATGVGTSLVQDASMLQETLGSMLHSATLQSLGTLSAHAGLWPMFLPLLALPLVFPARRARAGLPLVAWCTASWVALLVVARTLGYLQPYHLAVVLPLHALLSAWGVAGLLARLPVPRTTPFPQLRFALGVALGLGVIGGTALALRSEVEGPLAAPAAHLDQLGIIEKPPEDHWKIRDPEMETRLLEEYYKFKGWNDDGIPTKETLDQLGIIEPAVDALRADAQERPRVLGVLAETRVSRIGDPIAYFMEQWLAGEPDASFLLIRPPEPGRPMVYLVADLSPETWAAWPHTELPVWSLDLPGGSRAGLLSFGHVADARRWLRAGCSLVHDRGLRLASPWEGMAFMAQDSHPFHEDLVSWVKVCDPE